MSKLRRVQEFDWHLCVILCLGMQVTLIRVIAVEKWLVLAAVLVVLVLFN